jgi:hypothetical protein
VRRSKVGVALLAALALGGFGPPAVAAARTPGPDASTCFGGNCTLRVSGPAEIPLDGKIGPTALIVSKVGTDVVTFGVRSGARDSYAITGARGEVRFSFERGILTVRVRELAGGAATLELSTTPSGT